MVAVPKPSEGCQSWWRETNPTILPHRTTTTFYGQPNRNTKLATMADPAGTKKTTLSTATGGDVIDTSSNPVTAEQTSTVNDLTQNTTGVQANEETKVDVEESTPKKRVSKKTIPLLPLVKFQPIEKWYVNFITAACSVPPCWPHPCRGVPVPLRVSVSVKGVTRRHAAGSTLLLEPGSLCSGSPFLWGCNSAACRRFLPRSTQFSFQGGDPAARRRVGPSEANRPTCPRLLRV